VPDQRVIAALVAVASSSNLLSAGRSPPRKPWTVVVLAERPYGLIATAARRAPAAWGRARVIAERTQSRPLLLDLLSRRFRHRPGEVFGGERRTRSLIPGPEHPPGTPKGPFRGVQVIIVTTHRSRPRSGILGSASATGGADPRSKERPAGPAASAGRPCPLLPRRTSLAPPR